MPLRRSISAFLLATSVGQSKVTSLTGTFQPYPAASSSSSRTLAPYTNSFFGTQPIFTQVPPRCQASTTATRAPRWADIRAKRTPPEPAPITIRSKSWLSDTVSPVYTVSQYRILPSAGPSYRKCQPYGHGTRLVATIHGSLINDNTMIAVHPLQPGGHVCKGHALKPDTDGTVATGLKALQGQSRLTR